MPETLADGVWRIDCGSVNAYLVDDPQSLTLVDAGMAWDAGTVRSAIHDAGFAVSDLERVLVTHYDADHVGGLSRLPIDVPVHVGERDADLVAGRRVPPVSNLKGFTQRVSRLLHYSIDAPVEAVADGEEVGSFTAIHTPGHTRGHTAFASEALDVAFVGDLVTSDGDAFSPTPWYLNWDDDQIRPSIERLVERLPDVSVLAPGHGDPITEGAVDALSRLAD
ncbi:MAG: MBL fold metallo-hydrolase [Halanaeroarchaeum sp.]